MDLEKNGQFERFFDFNIHLDIIRAKTLSLRVHSFIFRSENDFRDAHMII